MSEGPIIMHGSRFTVRSKCKLNAWTVGTYVLEMACSDFTRNTVMSYLINVNCLIQGSVHFSSYDNHARIYFLHTHFDQ